MGLVKKRRHGRGRTGPARRRSWAKCGCLWVADLRIDGERRYVPLGHDAHAARAAHAQLLADRAAGRLFAAAEGAALVAVGSATWQRSSAPGASRAPWTPTAATCAASRNGSGRCPRWP